MKKILFIAEYLLVRCVFAGLSVMPWFLLEAIARTVGFCGYHVMGRRRRDAYENINRAYGTAKTEAEKRAIVKGSFVNLIRTYLELAVVTRDRNKVLSFIACDPADVARLHQLHGRGRGLIFLTAHVGNWEFLSLLAGALGLKLTSIGRSVKNGLMASFINDLRSVTGSSIVDKEEAVRGSIEVLRRGECLGTLVDQRAGNSGIMVDFFGVPANATPFPALMKMRFDCALLPVFCIRKKTGKFLFVVGDEIVLPQGVIDKSQIVRFVTEGYTAAIERVVRAYPDQWLWFHRRWRK